MPPPTQGATTLHTLMMLEQADLKSVSPDSSERINILLEKAYYAYCIRDQYISDPRYMEISSSDLVSRDFLFKALEMCRDHPSVGDDGDTTFFAVADREGWVVSAIQSLFHGFGSFITEPKYGITLNSRASSFKLDDRSVNRLEPWKKTMHTLSSMIVVEENRVLALGLSGGHYRPLLHSQVLTNIIDYGMDVQDALEYPRFIWLIDSNVVEYEEGLKPNNPRYEFVMKPYPSRTGVAAAVERMGRVIAGYCDIRGDGLPIGLL